MNTKQAFSTLLTVLITAVVVGVLVGVTTYTSVAFKKDLEIEDLKEKLSKAKEEAQVEPGSTNLETNNADNQSASPTDGQPASDDQQTKETITTPNLTPEKTVENFYNWYINYPSDAKKGDVLSSGAYKTSPYISDELIKNVEATIASFKGPGGYDPILCAQDTPSKVTVGKATISRKEANVNVTEDFVGKPTLKVGLKLLDNQWEITSVSCPNQ